VNRLGSPIRPVADMTTGAVVTRKG
jgi:hypothetical protein